MCTVTFLPGSKGCYLTTNRDEHQDRKAAISPEVYNAGEYRLLYPKDPDKGGSWIAANSNGDAVVLLNGAFIKHNQNAAYSKSRGLIVLEALKSTRPNLYFQNSLLENVEPFTLIIYTDSKLYECRWDGVQKHILQLNEHEPYIWSSATLYNDFEQKAKAERFAKWLNTDVRKNSETLFDFHQTERLDGTISTVSITQVQVTAKKALMIYNNLKATVYQVSYIKFNNQSVPLVRLRGFFTKLINWEYWPSYVIYAPVMFYWFWLSIKSRSLFFFNTANPGIKNGGFAMESKNEIYALIPQQYYPKTQFIKAGSNVSHNQMQLPLIAKPDIGQRGLQVKLLKTGEQLSDYVANSKVDFLLQEYINYPNEAGIFYYRLPGSSDGVITGVAGKELMTVTGDGTSTLMELLSKDPRYMLQIAALYKADSLSLQEVPAQGKVCIPAPYGNHCRGAKFIDLSHQITPQLVKNTNAVCKQIPGFYFGRLDVKYNTWEDLCAGRFMIIEVNGASSEPAHIYDPKHSVFFAWKEIIRHWGILYDISKLNKQKRGISYMTYKEGVAMIKDNARYLNLTEA